MNTHLLKVIPNKLPFFVFLSALLILLLSLGVSATMPDQAYAGTWKKNSVGWWYKNDDGTYPKSTWQEIDGVRYKFNSKGYMQTGWIKDGSKWYYAKKSGALATGWVKSGKKWYYLNSEGVMQTGWVQPDKKTWYYLNSSGAMVTGWFKVGGKWYYANSSGAMQKSKWISGKYYVGSDGIMLANTWTPDGYWVNKSGLYTNNGQVEAVLSEAATWANSYESTADKLSAVAYVVYSYASNSTYGSNSSGTYATPYGLIIDHKYTCAGTAAMCAEILSRMGYKNITHTNKNQYKHQWVEVKTGGEWWIVEGMMGFAAKKKDAPNYPNGTVKLPNGMEIQTFGGV